MFRKLIPFLFILITAGQISAQRYFGVSGEEFGKSKIQNRSFQWKYFESEHFQFNFYRGGEQIAKNSALHLEKTYPKITDILGYLPYDPINIFIFNNLNDLNSTNLSSGLIEMETGVVIDSRNSRLLTAYDSNDSTFFKQLTRDVASVYIYNMLYGGSVRETLENQILLNLPEWFTAGAAAYIAEDDNSMMFDQFKETIIASQNVKLSSLRGSEAGRLGQSIWHYIALKYGKNYISNILNLTRIIHDEQAGITSTLGISFPRFIKEWRDFYVAETPLVEDPETVIPHLTEKLEFKTRYTDLLPGEVDTDDYVFDEKNIVLYKEKDQRTITANIPENNGQSREFTQADPNVKLSAVRAFSNFLINNDKKLKVLVDPVRHFGVGYDIEFSDLLQNNVFQFTSYLKPTTPLFKNYDYELSYGNYTHKIDYFFSYQKRSINFESIGPNDAFLFRPLNLLVPDDRPEYISRRLAGHTLSASMIYPFSGKLKAEITPKLIKNDDIEYALSLKNGVNSDYYFAPNVSLVFDNTKISKLGVETGTKARLSANSYFDLKNTRKNNFQNYYLDLRHYQRIINGIQLAGRLSYGMSRGSNKQFTFIGGVENNLNRTNYKTNVLLMGGDSDMKNILFYNFPGSLRGFDFGQLYGNNHLLTNIELRSHLSEFMPQAALSSSFIRNFQIIGFFDLGTAWLGKAGPFSRQNSLNTSIVMNGPFVIEVTNFKNPFLSSFGAGARTNILGIFVRADYAFGYEDSRFNRPKFHISIGKDF